MMRKDYYKILLLMFLAALLLPETLFARNGDRRLVASINKVKEACYPSNDYTATNNKILISWRQLSLDESLAFNIYREMGGKTVKINDSLITLTNFIDTNIETKTDRTYILTDEGGNELDRYTMRKEQVRDGLPYFTIDLQSTTDISSEVTYIVHDGSIGDLDGDGEPEIVVRREISDVEKWSGKKELHSELWEAYRLDGTFLWRVCSGPNIATGNSASFAVYDFDGDGRCEVALRSCEGMVFGDNKEIGDTNNDRKTDYRDGTEHVPNCPDFISVINGMTGTELARAPYIPMISSEEWGDNYNKRAASLRTGAAKVVDNGTAIIISRGIYAKMEIEAWKFDGNTLEKIWNWHSSKDKSDPYFGQGYHSLSVGDVDGDGYDEIVYGSCTIDHNGESLYSSALGHGDALHLGHFVSDYSGLQIWSCCENGGPYMCQNYAATLRDAATGEIIWGHKVADPKNADCGRALVADIDPSSPGCEMWYAGSNVYSQSGEDLGYQYTTANMAMWFDGGLNRQLYDRNYLDVLYRKNGEVNWRRPLRMDKYGAASIYGQGMKYFPIIYGDFLGDWREEIVMLHEDQTKMMVFCTWYPTDYTFLYLRSDHLYDMSMVNQNIGYNQPTQLSYLLGTETPTVGIEAVKCTGSSVHGSDIFNLHGQKVGNNYKGLIIKDGKKCFIK